MTIRPGWRQVSLKRSSNAPGNGTFESRHYAGFFFEHFRLIRVYAAIPIILMAISLGEYRGSYPNQSRFTGIGTVNQQ